MKKISKVLLVIALTVLLMPKVNAAGTGDMLISASNAAAIKENIVVKYSSISLPGYAGSISNTITLSSGSMYIAQVPGLPAGDYNIEAHFTQAGTTDLTEYKNPNYTLDYPSTISIADGQIYQLALNVIPWSEVNPTTAAPDGVTPAPTEAPIMEGTATTVPTPTPNPQDGTMGGLIIDIIKNTWFTLLIAVIALAIWGGLALRKAIYKD